MTNATRFKVYDTAAYKEQTLLQMLTDFHNKFGTPYDGQPRELAPAELEFRLVCHTEESREYADAIAAGNLVEALDALADELYFLTGTAHRQGFGPKVTEVNVNLGYRMVKPHFLCPDAANMRAARHAAVLTRYADRARRGDLDGQADALSEAIRAFRATAQMHCFDIDEALRRVHAANMTKDVDPAKQRRTAELKAQGVNAGHLLEITKPEGWLPPYLGDLAGEGAYVEDELPAAVLRNNGKSNLCGLITIDGPDASGKTTLAKRIAELFNGQVIHLTWSKQLEAVMHDYRFHAINYAEALAHNCVVVLERPWLSHPVYAEVYRDGKYDAERVAIWKDHTETAALLNIIALPGDIDQWFAGYKQMCDTREELHGPNESKARAVYEGFRDAFSGAAGPAQQPQNVEVYDMQQYKPSSVDLFITEYVLPVLRVKE